MKLKHYIATLLLLIMALLMPQQMKAGVESWILNGVTYDSSGATFTFGLDIFNYDGKNSYWSKGASLKIDGNWIRKASDHSQWLNFSDIWGGIGTSNEDSYNLKGGDTWGTLGEADFYCNGLTGHIRIWDLDGNYTGKWSQVKMTVRLDDYYGHTVSVDGYWYVDGNDDGEKEFNYVIQGFPRPKEVSLSQSGSNVNVSWTKEEYQTSKTDNIKYTSNVSKDGAWYLYRGSECVAQLSSSSSSKTDTGSTCYNEPTYTYRIVYMPNGLTSTYAINNGLSKTNTITMAHRKGNNALAAALVTSADCTHPTEYRQTCDYCHYQYSTTYIAQQALGHSYNSATGVCSRDDSHFQPITAASDGVYEIRRAGDLGYFADLVNGGKTAVNARLMNDIDMTFTAHYSPAGYATSLDNLAYNSSTISQKGFCGVFDGQGHTINNLTMRSDNIASQCSKGVFGNVSGTVKNLKVNNYTFSNTTSNDGRFGAICGVLLKGGVIDRCCVTNSSLSDGSHIVGVLAGANYAGTIRSSYVYNCTHKAHSRCGVMVGDNRNDNKTLNGNMMDCCSDSPANTNGSFYVTSGTYRNVNYGVTKYAFEHGEATYKLNGNVGGGSVWFQNINNGKTEDLLPSMDNSHGKVYYAYIDCTASEKTYNNNATNYQTYVHEYDADGFCVRSTSHLQPITGNGSAASPYVISNSAQLLGFAQKVNVDGETGAYGVLKNNIVFNKGTFSANGTYSLARTESPRIWTPIGSAEKPYKGKFNGQNCTISGLCYKNTKTDNVGLFGYCDHQTIENLCVANSYFYGRNNVGTICGYEWYGTIQKSYVASPIAIGSDKVGGICGSKNGGKMDMCYATNVNVTATTNAGGLCGEAMGSKVSDAYTTGTLKGSAVGGISGASNDETVLSRCFVSATNLVGSGSPTLKDSEAGITDFANGVVCYKLNGKSNYTQSWGQKIGTDATPYYVSDAHPKVYALNKTYSNATSIEVPLTQVGNEYYTSLYTDFDYTISGAEVYASSYDDEEEPSRVMMTAVSGVIPAGTGVLLKGNSNKAILTLADANANKAEVESVLSGSDVDIESASASQLAFSLRSGVIGFFDWTGKKIPAFKAYLDYSAPEEAKAMVINFDDEATAINAVCSDNSNVDDADIYSIDGMKLSRMQKGLNIIRTADGKTKKVYIK